VYWEGVLKKKNLDVERRNYDSTIRKEDRWGNSLGSGGKGRGGVIIGGSKRNRSIKVILKNRRSLRDEEKPEKRSGGCDISLISYKNRLYSGRKGQIARTGLLYNELHCQRNGRVMQARMVRYGDRAPRHIYQDGKILSKPTMSITGTEAPGTCAKERLTSFLCSNVRENRSNDRKVPSEKGVPGDL